jgi:hypothetical protein
MARVVRFSPKFKKGDRVFYVTRTMIPARRSVGTIHGHDCWGFANGKNRDDGLKMRYSVVWDNYAHKENAHHTSVPEDNLQPLPAVERLAEIIHAPPTYSA